MLTLRDSPAFYNWLTDGDDIQRRQDDLVSGLVFDVENNDLWRDGWGTRPETVEGRLARVSELTNAAPRLIPVFSHRYLLAEPCQASNPLFSIVQSDIIIYGADLRTYFLHEFADLLGIESDKARTLTSAMIQARYSTYGQIPFWRAC